MKFEKIDEVQKQDLTNRRRFLLDLQMVDARPMDRLLELGILICEKGRKFTFDGLFSTIPIIILILIFYCWIEFDHLG
jgi:hypothetical protein